MYILKAAGSMEGSFIETRLDGVHERVDNGGVCEGRKLQR